MKVLYIDACPRSPAVSRTHRLGEAFMKEYRRLHSDADVRTLRLSDLNLLPFTGEMVDRRIENIAAARWDDPMFGLAREFAEAELIVIAAPYWDFMFPSVLKVYIEHVSVQSLTFTYVGDRPVGLCRADNLVFLTTAGSPMYGHNWGGDYLKAVTGTLFGVKHFHQVTAEGLDAPDADAERLVSEAKIRAKALAAML